MGLAEKLFGTASTRELKRIKPIVNAVLGKDAEYSALSGTELRGRRDSEASGLVGQTW